MATDAREEERSVEGGGGGTEGREKKRGREEGVTKTNMTKELVTCSWIGTAVNTRPRVIARPLKTRH